MKTSESKRTMATTAISECNASSRRALACSSAAPLKIAYTPVGSFTFLGHQPLGFSDEPRYVAARRIARHRLPPPRSIMLNDEPPGREKNIRQFAQRKPRSLAVREHQITDVLRTPAALFIQHHREFEDAVSIEELRRVRALKRRFARLPALPPAESQIASGARTAGERQFAERQAGAFELHIRLKPGIG